MPRFNILNVAPNLFRYRDNESKEYDETDDSSNNDENVDMTYSSEDDNNDEMDHDSELYHPPSLKYSIGTTRFALNEEESLSQYKRRCGYLMSYSGEVSYHTNNATDAIDSNYRVDPQTAQTSILVRYAANHRMPYKNQQSNHIVPTSNYDDDNANYSDSEDYGHRCLTELDEDVDMLTQLLAAADVSDGVDGLLKLQYSMHKNNSALAKKDIHDDRNIAYEIKEISKRYDHDHREAALALANLIEGNRIKADRIVALEQEAKLIHEEKEEEKERNRLEAIENQEKEEEASKIRYEAQQKQQQKQREQEEQKKREDRVSKDEEYVLQAKKLIGKLKLVQKSVEPFENNKLVAKRRLLFKKTVNGKVNTLAENVDKIIQVANEVSNVINNARNDDEQMKKSFIAKDPNILPEMILGKRYMIDLFCSKVIVRVQAEGFNGQRGDGFPLAAMLAAVSKENKDLIPMVAAHIYTVCPTAIPSLPHTTSDASEDEFMASLGMLKINKKDEPIQFESFERFLSRTEGVISLVADIMSSQPSTHTLLDGHNGAIQWLKRFLSLLPEAPNAPLPLVTAPVLDAFLRGAGHMLANHHADEFKPILHTITNDLVNRLDVSSIGMPSSIRLKKTIEGGFEGFRDNLPSRAMPELYYGANGGNQVNHSAQGFSSSSTSSGPFSSSTNAMGGNFANSTSPFGISSTSTNQNVKGFGSAATNSPFSLGASIAPPSTASSMMSNSESNMNPSPFGLGSSSMTQPPGAGNSSFGQSINTTNPSPFGQAPSNTGASPFGAGSNMMGSNFTTTNPSPFGGSVLAPSPSPFGGGSMDATSATNASSSFATPFGSSPFSISGAAPSFGASTPAPSTFGSATNQQAPFGTGASASPFGSSGLSTQQPFGGSIGSVTSATNSSPFGSNNTSTMTSPFGGPFGNSGAQNPSPFGNPNPGSAPEKSSPFSSFGGAQQSFNKSQQQKPPCHFFAQGKCNKGANCRFSHETTAQSNNFSSPFGGPRR